MSEGPYRDGSIELAFDWRTEAEVDEKLMAILELLEERGVEAGHELVVLRAAAEALLEAEPDTAVFVAWQLGRDLNRLLEKAGSSERLYRMGEKSERWLLANSDEVAIRRRRGEELLERPPPVASPLAIAVIASAFVTLLVLIAIFLYVGTLTAFLIWVGILVLSGAYRIAGKAPTGWLLGAFEILTLAVPVVELVRLGELGWLALFLGVAGASFLFRAWAARRLAESSEPAST